MMGRGDDLDIERYREKIGCYIQIPNIGRGKLKYVGPVESKQGYFAGIDLLANIGKNNGSYNGRRYFETKYPLSGLFIQLPKVGYLIERATESTVAVGDRNSVAAISPPSRRSTLGGGGGSSGSLGNTGKSRSIDDTRRSSNNFDSLRRSFLKQKSPTPVGRSLRTSSATFRMDINSNDGNASAEMGDRMHGMVKSASTMGMSLEQQYVPQQQHGKLMPPVNVNNVDDSWGNNTGNNVSDNVDDEMSIDMTPQSAPRNLETAPVPAQTARNSTYDEVAPQIVKDYELKIERQRRVISEYEKLLNEQRVLLEEIQPVIDACEKKSQRLEQERDQLKEQLEQEREQQLKQKQYFEKEHEQLMDVLNRLREEINENEKQAEEERKKRQEEEEEKKLADGAIKEEDIMNSQIVMDLKAKVEELGRYKADMEYAKTKWDKEREQLKMHTESLSKEYQNLNKELMDALNRQQEAERNAKEVESLRKQLKSAKDKIKELTEHASAEGSGDTAHTNSLPLYEPEKKVDAAAGRKQWCVLCEKFGHIQIDCPFQHEGQLDQLRLVPSKEGSTLVDVGSTATVDGADEEVEMYY